MKTVRIGIIGTGIIAREHLEKYAKIEGAQVVAACDIDEQKLGDACDAFGIQHRYTDYRRLLERDDLDAVDVCVHNNLHAPIAIDVMRSGKHAYCEKPMAGAYADAAAMRDAAKSLGKMLHIQLAFLYSPETHAAQRLIQAGRLGNIYHARSTGFRRRGRPFVDGYATKEFNSKAMASGGAMYDMGVYHISQLLYLLDCPRLVSVSGQTYQELEMDAERRAISGFDVDELGVGFARFENGLTLDIIESWAIHADPFEGSLIAGSKGGLRLQPLKFMSFQDDMAMTSQFELEKDDWRFHQLNPALSAYDSSQKHWIAALRGEVPLLPTADIALQTMLVSEGIYRSGALGREVTVAEMINESMSSALREQETPFGRLVYAAHSFL